MNRLYPIFLVLSGKPCVVVGGGPIALQKTRALCDAEADVTVITPECVDELKLLVRQADIRLRQRGYESGDLDGTFLVIAATNQPELNKMIREEALEKNVLCNVVDNPELCDFYVPSIHTAGDLKIAISSNAKSPAVSKKIRRELEELYGPTVAEALRLSARARETLKKQVPDYRERGRLLSKVLGNQPLYKMEREGKPALERLRKDLGQWI